MRAIEYPGVGDTLWTGELANGLAVYVVPRPGFRKKHASLAVNYGGAMRAYTLGGERHETPAGTAHFLEHKMFDLPEGSALDILTRRGAEANAYTSAGRTEYYFECGERFDENLELLLKFVSTPYFTPESVEKERGIIAQEILMTEDDPSFALYTAAMGALFERHPLRESVAGTVESIAEITPEVLYDCHRAFYAPGNMALTVCGDVEPEAVAEAAARVLGDGKAPAAEPDFGEPEGLEPHASRVSREMDVSDPMFICAAKLSCALPRGDSALRLTTAGSLAARCLFGAGSDFYTSLYASGELRSDFFRDVSPMAGTLLFECGGTASDPDAVCDKIRAELSRAAEAGLDPDAFERARRADYGAMLRTLGSPDGLCSSLAAAHFGGWSFYEGFGALERVTKAEADEFVREYLRAERLALALVTPKERT